MTAVNRMIKEAKTTTANTVYIRLNEVRAVAEHMRKSMFDPEKHSIDWFVKQIHTGECKVLDKKLHIIK